MEGEVGRLAQSVLSCCCCFPSTTRFACNLPSSPEVETLTLSWPGPRGLGSCLIV